MTQKEEDQEMDEKVDEKRNEDVSVYQLPTRDANCVLHRDTNKEEGGELFPPGPMRDTF